MSALTSSFKHPDGMVVEVLARTLWGEARGQGEMGLRAVAHVVNNRVRLAYENGGAWWGNDVIAICRKPYQFSCWNLNDPNREKLMAVDQRNAEYRLCLKIAAQVMTGLDTDDITLGGTHYHRFDIAPNWSKGRTPTIQIGDHVFFDLSEDVS